MITDLSKESNLERATTTSGLDQTKMGRGILHDPWRQLLLLDRDHAVAPTDQARQEAITRLTKSMALLPDQDWILRPIPYERWIDFVSRAFSGGLAYGGPDSGRPFPEAPEDRPVLKLINDFAEMFVEPDCSITWSDEIGAWSWSPVSSHTFDAAALIVDRKRIGMLVIVDED
jgi:hypothetical protein